MTLKFDHSASETEPSSLKGMGTEEKDATILLDYEYDTKMDDGNTLMVMHKVKKSKPQFSL